MAQVIILGPGSRVGSYQKAARYHKNIVRRGRASARVALNFASYSHKKNKQAEIGRQGGGGAEQAGPDGLGQDGWRGPQGETSYAEVRGWIREQARQHPYTVKLVLSSQAGVRLSADQWQSVMGADAEFKDFRLIPHRDTKNDHAHILAFAHRYMRKADFMTWRRSIVARVAALEQAAQREQRSDLGRSAGQGAELG